MTRARLTQLMEACAADLAVANGFEKAVPGYFFRDQPDRVEWFVASYDFRYGAGFFTLGVAVGVTELEGVTGPSINPDTKRPYPSFGGPLFRHVDLRSTSLSNYIVEFSSDFELEDSRQKLTALWRSDVEPFFARFSSSDAWIAEATAFLAHNKIGALHVTHAGRICVALMYAAEGRDSARRALETLAVRGGNKTPVQDFLQSQQLFERIEQNIGILEPLKAVLGRNKQFC